MADGAAPDKLNEQTKADLALLGLTAIWGATFILVKDALADADVWTFIAIRFALGGTAAVILGRKQLKAPGLISAGVILGLLVFAGFALQTIGLLSTSPSRSAFITGLNVVLVPFTSIFVLKRWPQPPAFLGVILAVAGLAYITGVGTTAASGEGVLRGDLLTAGCTVAYAFHITLTAKFAPKLPAMALTAVQLWTVFILAALLIPFGHPHLAVSPRLLGAVVFCGLFATAGAIGIQTWAQARTSPVRAALIYSLEPVFAAAYSVGLGREVLTIRVVLGGGLIIIGIVVAEVGGYWWRSRSV